MLEALTEFLKSKGYSNIFGDFLPAKERQNDVIFLSEWSNPIAEINDGSSVHFVQIQVRRRTYKAAKAVCTELFLMLDSGLDENLFQLTDTVFCIARPRRGPLILERSETHTTFYYELALWG